MATRKQKAVGGAGPASSPADSPQEAESASPVPGSPRPAGRGEVVVPAGQDGRSSVRERLVRATIDVVSVVGYEAVVSDQIVEASGLSRTVLYRHLGGKQPAVLAVARQILDGLTRTVRAALAEHDAGHGVDQDASARAGQRRSADPSRPSPGRAPAGRLSPERADADESSLDRVAVGLTALTEALAADPPAAAVLVLEAPAAGHDARPLRATLLALIAEILDGHGPGAANRPTSLLGITSAGGYSPAMRAGALHHILHHRIARGHTVDLPNLVPDLTRVVAAFPP